jgi:hypothetical protein
MTKEQIIIKRKLKLLDLIFETELDKCEVIIIELEHLDNQLEIITLNEDINQLDNKIDLTLTKLKNNVNNLKSMN